jgi:hypothetical protein
METFGTTYAKAIDDLAGKIFIPALISSLMVEFGPAIQIKFGLGFFSTYILICILGVVAASGIMLAIFYITIFIFRGHDISAEIGVFLMPLGFAGLFPEQFSDFSIPFSQVTGVAILSWAFMLVKGKRFFHGFFFGDEH